MIFSRHFLTRIDIISVLCYARTKELTKNKKSAFKKMSEFPPAPKSMDINNRRGNQAPNVVDLRGQQPGLNSKDIINLKDANNIHGAGLRTKALIEQINKERESQDTLLDYQKIHHKNTNHAPLNGEGQKPVYIGKNRDSIVNLKNIANINSQKLRSETAEHNIQKQASLNRRNDLYSNPNKQESYAQTFKPKPFIYREAPAPKPDVQNESQEARDLHENSGSETYHDGNQPQPTQADQAFVDNFTEQRPYPMTSTIKDAQNAVANKTNNEMVKTVNPNGPSFVNREFPSQETTDNDDYGYDEFAKKYSFYREGTEEQSAEPEKAEELTAREKFIKFGKKAIVASGLLTAVLSVGMFANNFGRQNNQESAPEPTPTEQVQNNQEMEQNVEDWDMVSLERTDNEILPGGIDINAENLNEALADSINRAKTDPDALLALAKTYQEAIGMEVSQYTRADLVSEQGKSTEAAHELYDFLDKLLIDQEEVNGFRVASVTKDHLTPGAYKVNYLGQDGNIYWTNPRVDEMDVVAIALEKVHPDGTKEEVTLRVQEKCVNDAKLVEDIINSGETIVEKNDEYNKEHTPAPVIKKETQPVVELEKKNPDKQVIKNDKVNNIYKEEESGGNHQVNTDKNNQVTEDVIAKKDAEEKQKTEEQKQAEELAKKQAEEKAEAAKKAAEKAQAEADAALKKAKEEAARLAQEKADQELAEKKAKEAEEAQKLADQQGHTKVEITNGSGSPF